LNMRPEDVVANPARVRTQRSVRGQRVFLISKMVLIHSTFGKEQRVCRAASAGLHSYGAHPELPRQHIVCLAKTGSFCCYKNEIPEWDTE